MTPEEHRLKKLTPEEFTEITNFLIRGDIDELRTIAKDAKTSVIKAMVAAIAIKTISRGDMVSLDRLLDRIMGKVKERIEHTGIPSTTPTVQVLLTLPRNGSEADVGS